jgi:vitamin B12 transporter
VDHSTFGTETATRLAAGLWLRPLEGAATRLHASWGQGFKSPTFFENFDDAFYDLGIWGTIRTVGNPDLEPEKVVSMDAGVEEHLFDDKVIAGATLFQNRFRDYIVFEPGAVVGTYANAGRAQAQGVEYELKLKPADWARARGALTVTHSRAETDDSSPSFDDGRPLIRRPERALSAVAEFEPLGPWKGAPEWARKITVFGEVLRQENTVDVDWDIYRRVRLEDWTVVNVGASWEFWKGLRLFGRWENVGDVQYEQAAGISGPRSSFLGGVGWTLNF